MPQDVWPTVAKVVVINEPIKTPPAPHMVRIYAKDGSFQDVYPVDAKEAIAGGEYSYEARTSVTEQDDIRPDTQEVGSLDPLKKDELIGLAKVKGIDTKNMTKADIIEALTAESA